jgi:hypothetical protein
MRDNAIQLEGLMGVIQRLSEDARICLEGVDASSKEETPDEDVSSYCRRMYARSVINFLDGITYRLMYHAYAARFRPEVMLTADEIQRLEKYYDFDEGEEAQTILSQSQMLENIRFAFRTFARVHYSDYVLPTHAPEWVFIKEIARLRDALLYPRAADELEVFEENIETLLEGMKWFSQRLADLFSEIKDSTLERINEWQANEDEIIM